MEGLQEWIADAFRALQMGIDPCAPDWDQQVLKRLEILFDEEGHCLTPWHALYFAHRRGLSVPPWVLEFFSDRYVRICSVVADDLPAKQSEAEAIGRALGFGGDRRQGSNAAGRAASKSHRGLWYAVEVAVEYEIAREASRKIVLKTAAGKVAARNGVSRSTVERAYRDHRDRADAIMQAFLRTITVQETGVS